MGLNLGVIEGDRRANVEENRKRFFRRLGASSFSLASLRQIHSAEIYQVGRGPSGKFEYRPSGSGVGLSSVAAVGACPQGRDRRSRVGAHRAPLQGLYPAPQPSHDLASAGDALLTDQDGILLSVRTADCLPILVVDPTHRAVAAVHAGWRGTLQCIPEKVVAEMRRLFGSNPRELLAAIGPSIRACCYEVGEEVVDAFCGRFAKADKFFSPVAALSERRTRTAVPPLRAGSDRRYSRTHPLLSLTTHPRTGAMPCAPASVTTMHLDLVAVACHELRSAGLRSSNIHVADFCTACRTDLFFSHRKEGSHTGRMMTVIGIRPL